MNGQTLKETIEHLDDYFQEVNHDKVERIRRIKKVQDFLNFTLRFTELSDEEQEDYVATIKSKRLTTAQKKHLEQLDNENKKTYLESIGRSLYFRQFAWNAYMYGETNDKPQLVTKTQ